MSERYLLDSSSDLREGTMGVMHGMEREKRSENDHVHDRGKSTEIIEAQASVEGNRQALIATEKGKILH
jgi:hypothetical protein